MCPNCRAFVTVDDKVCPYCDTKLTARAIDRRAPPDIAGIIPASRFTTVVILLVSAGMYAATTLYSMQATGGQAVMNIDIRTLALFGAKVPEFIYAGQWWRLITAGFLHGGVLHILMNSYVIFDLGTNVEELYGTERYVVLYFLSTVAGFAVSTWWSPAVSVGASAGLFGLIGAMIAFGVRNRRSSMAASMRAHYTQWAIWGVAMGLMPGFRVDNAAHLGGLAAGFLTGYLAGTPPLYARWTEQVWRIAAALCVLITLAAFAMMVSFLVSVKPSF